MRDAALSVLSLELEMFSFSLLATFGVPFISQPPKGSSPLTRPFVSRRACSTPFLTPVFTVALIHSAASSSRRASK